MTNGTGGRGESHDANVTEAEVQRLLDRARKEREKNAANEE